MNKAWYKLHADDDWYDGIRIWTKPRYKTSGLSGDEWRVSIVVQVLRKERVLIEKSFGSLETALKWLPWGLVEEGNFGVSSFPPNLCDQPGCSEKATTFYKLKEEYEKNGSKSEYQPGTAHRKFCARHAERGDCGREDADRNYELVAGNAPSGGTRESDDARPSVFGGAIVLPEGEDK